MQKNISLSPPKFFSSPLPHHPLCHKPKPQAKEDSRHYKGCYGYEDLCDCVEHGLVHIFNEERKAIGLANASTTTNIYTYNVIPPSFILFPLQLG